MSTNQKRKKKIKARIRGKINGTTARPRLSVFRSNKFIYGQIIDDSNGETLVTVSSKDESTSGTMIEQAKNVGKALGEKALGANINTVVFDRNGYLYHGRVKSFAEGAREGGLIF